MMLTGFEIAALTWAVAPIASFLINKLDLLKGPFQRTLGIEKDVNSLRHNLIQINAVFSAAEKLKVNVDEPLAELLRIMKIAMYDADDVIDEYNCQMAAYDAKTWIENKASSVKTAALRFVNADGLRKRLSKAIKGMKAALKTAKTFTSVAAILNNTQGEGSTQPAKYMAPERETTCIHNETDTVGRGHLSVSIKQQILEQARCNTSTPLVISVVGEAGMGKTTLAQMVYNDKKLDPDDPEPKVFEKMIWVCVANYFDVVRVSKDVLAVVKPEFQSADCSLQVVQTELIKSLRSKKFLLVLDDVWVDEVIKRDENKEDKKVTNKLNWNNFILPFKQCGAGSSIVVTTRLNAVVEMIGDCNEVNLVGLSPEDSDQLFISHAFGGGVTHSKELDGIGREIVGKLNGLPLSLKLIGMHLNEKSKAIISENKESSEKEKQVVAAWKDVLRNIVSAAGNILCVLKLSYDHLPSHLKLCFAYCSIFPNGYYFSGDQVDQLIHMWVAQGFVENKNTVSRDLDVVGRGYFDDLCSRSFFQPIKDGGEISYVMHDLMNGLAKHVSEEDCCQIQADSSSIPSTVRHVSISVTHLPLLSKIPDLNKMRTVVVLNPSKKPVQISVDKSILASLGRVRVLDVTVCCSEKLPKTITRMIHLRYIACGPTSMLLPSTCSGLFYLQVLSMTCHRCTTGLHWFVPKNIRKLQNLRHVYISDIYSEEIADAQLQGEGQHSMNSPKAKGLMDRLSWKSRHVTSKTLPAFISASDPDLRIVHLDDEHWKFVGAPGDQRFTAELSYVWWLQIEVTIDVNKLKLSPEQNYGAHLIFTTKPSSIGLDTFQKAYVRGGLVKWKKVVCLNPSTAVQRNQTLGLPVERSDGWMELELGQFYSDNSSENQKVIVGIMETDNYIWKSGLTVAGIEIRSL